MLLFNCPKNRSLVRRDYPRAKIEQCDTWLLNPAARFFVVDRPHGAPISSPTPTRQSAWRDAAERIAISKARKAHVQA